MVKVINPAELKKYKDILYSVDRRLYKNRPSRKSILEYYNHGKKLIDLIKYPIKIYLQMYIHRELSLGLQNIITLIEL